VTRCPHPARLLARLLVAGLVLAGTTGLGDTPALAGPAPSGAPVASGLAHPDLDFMGWSRRGTAGPTTGGSTDAVTQTPGIDVSHFQGTVNWASQFASGVRFTWIKATEGVTFRDSAFSANYTGSFNAGVIRGAYHFGLPDRSTGATQANFFVDHGGGWSADGRTLPGALDMEYNPYGATCYGLSKAAMTQWILDFSNRYKARWNKFPAIYTSTSWWSQCVSGDFSSTNPLWVARYASSVGTLPCCWGFYTVWQFSSTPIDQNTFNGAYSQLQVFATNHD
jgi:GH25 family lysozyme M1 (1,4-beta-N-acetylmuramidase)